MNGKKLIITVFIVLILVTIFHCLTLTISPLVWADEVYMNSMAVDFMKHGTFYSLADPLGYGSREVLIYGPIYFVMDASIIKFFGNGPFQGRLLSFLFGLFIIIAITFFSFSNVKNKKIWFFIFLAFVLDPFFNAGMNRGRMDNVATFFFFISSVLILRKSKMDEKKIVSYFLSAIIMAICLLTTFRLFLFIPALFFIAVLQLYQSENKIDTFKKWSCWGITLLVVYSIWIFGKFGSYIEFINYYSFINKSTGSVFLGGSFTFPIEAKPLILTSVLLFLIALFINRKVLMEEISLYCIAVFFSYCLLIGDAGPYCIILIPFLYLFIAQIIDAIKEGNKILSRISMTVIFFLVAFNLGTFVFKGIVLLLDAPARNYNIVNDFVKRNIPENSNVAADDFYYYGIINGHSNYQMYYAAMRDIVETEKIQREKFNYDYLLVSDRTNNRTTLILDQYSKNATLVKVAEIKTKHFEILKWLSSIQFFKKFGTFGNYDFSSDGYDGVLYKRIK